MNWLRPMQGILSGRYELNRHVQDPLFQWNKVTRTLMRLGAMPSNYMIH